MFKYRSRRLTPPTILSCLLGFLACREYFIICTDITLPCGTVCPFIILELIWFLFAILNSVSVTKILQIQKYTVKLNHVLQKVECIK